MYILSNNQSSSYNCLTFNRMRLSYHNLTSKQSLAYPRAIIAVAIVSLSTTASVSPLSQDSDLRASGDSPSTDGRNVPAAPSKGPVSSAPYLSMVKQYAGAYGLDYRFVLALVKKESGFDANAVSDRGAYGLMQIMPPTVSEISDKLNLETMNTPRGNVRAGIYYFAEILKLFGGLDPENRLRLSLAAYFAGPSRIYDAQDVAAYIGENPTSWASVKSALPLLSKRFYSLHRAIWERGKPKNGYFGDWRQTLAYVDGVMENYKEYQKDFD